ncbi:alpha,alpha-trehalose-phosphate synthase (UDP-forming) [Glycocaulis sp.]|uniref:alpha,alpha-trehalose-phosphate synthase (UDP-forming) n=1 Tax=Glycocaulis sp. TaxID=1969725 RepID=UPI003D25F3F2
MSRKLSRLVLVSNRVPVGETTPGGLAVALKDALSTRQVLWFGWSGGLTDKTGAGLTSIRRGNVEYAVTDLTTDEYEGYYAGYANKALWPSFHYRLDLAEYQPDEFATYMAVNARFARELFERISPSDQIWIHDYHLIPLAAELRKFGVTNPIGFFSHIPFPSPEIFRAIPQHAALASGLMACDLVGFQSDRDRSNFERYAAEQAAMSALPANAPQTGGSRMRAMAFPIGIDAVGFAKEAETSAGCAPAALVGAGKCLILGVDRMDYSKGLVERVTAIETLLDSRPDLCERVSYIQVTPPSRGEVDAYAQLRIELETCIGHVNGRFTTLDWAPVRYLAQGLPRNELAGLYRDAAVGLVTPLRDGMNLVAKEFVAAQDPRNPGVLVLSEFAGVAEQLPEALIINPHDPAQQARAIEHALAMPLPERQERHAAMMDTLNRYDASWWCGAFLQELAVATSRSSAVQAGAAHAHNEPLTAPQIAAGALAVAGCRLSGS